MHAKKSLGQNFLVSDSVAAHIVDALGPRADETIIEIGPGRGALTSRLVERAERIIAVEFDHNLAPLLREHFCDRDNFILIEADALATDFCSVIEPAKRARVVANLPYNISTAILQKLLEQRQCLTEMILMLQREVVDRITAPPNGRERGFLSVLVEAYCEREALFDVAPEAFRPVPKVWSTVVRLRPRIAVEIKDELLFRNLVSAGFAQRRKTILNNFRFAPVALQSIFEEGGGVQHVLEAIGIEPQRRAETLTLEEWGGLTSTLKEVWSET